MAALVEMVAAVASLVELAAAALETRSRANEWPAALETMATRRR